jgi:hypothetical protein
MGKSIPVTVNGIHFPTKTALTGHVRKLITRYSVGMDVEGDDREFCIALFKFHPDSNLKLSSGINRVEVRLDEYGNKHFQLHRMDGTDDDISWPWCVRHAN